MKEIVDEKLAVKTVLPDLSPEVVDILRFQLLNFGRISRTYLTESLNLSEPEVKVICDEFEKATEEILSDHGIKYSGENIPSMEEK